MSQAADDLALIGLNLVASAEACDCRACRTLDLKHDIDLMAEDRQGLLWLVSYRDQSSYGTSFDTITLRAMNDKHNEDVQARKVADGRSSADLYVQGYSSHVMYCAATYVRDAIEAPCDLHSMYVWGGSGQVFRVMCPTCVPGMRRRPR